MKNNLSTIVDYFEDVAAQTVIVVHRRSLNSKLMWSCHKRV